MDRLAPSVLLANHVAEDASEQANVVDQRAVFLGGVVGGGDSDHGCNLVT